MAALEQAIQDIDRPQLAEANVSKQKPTSL
jgi:hypothetical protein